MWPAQYALLSIPVAALAYFMLGAVWYAALFGNTWMRLAKLNPDNIQQRAGAGPYIISAVSSLVVAFVLGWFLHSTSADTLPQFLGVGALASIGLVTSAAAKHYAFLGYSLRLLILDGGYDLVSFLAMSAIFWAWRA